MAKRLKYSVVGLPHYTIWHLYEPSVDDLKHMEEMEKEKKQKEAKDKAEKEKVAKINSQFDNPKTDWEKEKAEFEDMARKAHELSKAKSEAARIAQKSEKKPVSIEAKAKPATPEKKDDEEKVKEV
jgi:mannan polymerase II complex ANP1 subunit